MMTYDVIVKFLNEKEYTFFTYYDNSLKTKEIIVETEDEHTNLCYRFDKYGLFDRMWYSIGGYNSVLITMLECNVITNQFSHITNYYGGKKAKIRREDD